MIAHLSVLQALGWRWLCLYHEPPRCSQNRASNFLREPSTKVLRYVASIVLQTDIKGRRPHPQIASKAGAILLTIVARKSH